MSDELFKHMRETAMKYPNVRPQDVTMRYFAPLSSTISIGLTINK